MAAAAGQVGWMGDESTWLYALGLALSSSTDNFAVGTSLGLSAIDLPIQLNLIVSFCNATGALLASFGGFFLGQLAPAVAPLLAAAVFVYLGREEWVSYAGGSSASPLAKLAADGLAFRLAGPMTLNNLAGGVAGGAVGVSPWAAFVLACIASFVTMFAGHRLGRWAGPALHRHLDARVLAATIFFGLAGWQIYSWASAELPGVSSWPMRNASSYWEVMGLAQGVG